LNNHGLTPESCTKYRSEATKAVCLKRSWSDFDPQAYYLYGEDQNHETSFKGRALQAAVDSWCKIQVKALRSFVNLPSTKKRKGYFFVP
jgi:hypothetical protein